MKFIIDVPEEFKDLDGTLSIPCNIDASFKTGIKLEGYKEKGEEKIVIGDEVYYKDYYGNVSIFIVCGMSCGMAYGFKYPCSYDNSGDYYQITKLTKTGRHFPQVKDLLREIGGKII